MLEVDIINLPRQEIERRENENICNAELFHNILPPQAIFASYFLSYAIYLYLLNMIILHIKELDFSWFSGSKSHLVMKWGNHHVWIFITQKNTIQRSRFLPPLFLSLSPSLNISFDVKPPSRRGRGWNYFVFSLPCPCPPPHCGITVQQLSLACFPLSCTRRVSCCCYNVLRSGLILYVLCKTCRESLTGRGNNTPGGVAVLFSPYFARITHNRKWILHLTLVMKCSHTGINMNWSSGTLVKP